MEMADTVGLRAALKRRVLTGFSIAVAFTSSAEIRRPSGPQKMAAAIHLSPGDSAGVLYWFGDSFRPRGTMDVIARKKHDFDEESAAKAGCAGERLPPFSRRQFLTRAGVWA